MTINTAKLRAETLALIDGTTPGPWTITRQERWGYRATEYYYEVWDDDTNVIVEETTRAHGDGGRQNIRLIAAAPTLAADTLRLLDEIERLRAVLERIETASWHWAGYEAAPDAVHYAHESTARLASAALAEGGPDDR